jgi:hypothetical protein
LLIWEGNPAPLPTNKKIADEKVGKKGHIKFPYILRSAIESLLST